MSIEVLLFVAVGTLAVAAAGAMLLTNNAVHSAMFLILNFVCVAFLFLMLNAPFLAMVQIAVYAGAIMVLFLFVIMLLGAEQTGEPVREFKWLTPLALILSLAFLLVASIALIQGKIDEQETPSTAPMLRLVHAAPDFGDADIYLNGQLYENGVHFRAVGDYAQLPAGDYSLSIAVAGDDPAFALPVGTISLQNDSYETAIIYGEGFLPGVSVVTDDLSDLSGREGRLSIFNAFTGTSALNVVDAGADMLIGNNEVPDVLVNALEPGHATEPVTYTAHTVNWAVTAADNPDTIIFRLRDLDIAGGTSQLLIVGGERISIDDSLRIVTMPVVDETLPAFGSPESVGQSLFVKYLLPFEMVAVLLLAAMVGAIVLAQRGVSKPKPGRLIRRKVSRPLTSVISSQTGHDVSEYDPNLPRLTEPDAEQVEHPEPAGD